MRKQSNRDYCVAKYAMHRAARPDPSLRKERLLGMTIKLSHYRISEAVHGSLFSVLSVAKS
jgi:hypothetical protein